MKSTIFTFSLSIIVLPCKFARSIFCYNRTMFPSIGKQFTCFIFPYDLLTHCFLMVQFFPYSTLVFSISQSCFYLIYTQLIQGNSM